MHNHPVIQGRKILKLGLILFTLFLTACGSSGQPTPEPPPSYDIEKSSRDTTLAGQDTNGNGIRDDIDFYIAQNFKGEAVKQAQLMAKSAQEAIVSPPKDRTAVENLANTLIGSGYCLEEFAPSSVQELEYAFINTLGRAKAYAAFEDQAIRYDINSPAGLNCALFQGQNLTSQAAPDPYECDAGYVVLFQNGMFNGPGGAGAGTKQLKKIMALSELKSKNVYYDTNFNNSMGRTYGLINIFEVMAQKSKELGWNLSFFEYEKYIVNPEAESLWESIKDAGLKSIIRKLAGLEVELLASALVTVGDASANLTLQSLTFKVKNLIAQGHKVVLVSHSQGNFFAKDIYASLTASEKQSVGFVGVAVVSQGVPGNGPYFSYAGDKIVQGVRLIDSRVPSPNLLLRPTVDDWLGHNFIKVYAKDIDGTLDPFAAALKNGVLEQINKLPVPVGSCKNIRITNVDTPQNIKSGTKEVVKVYWSSEVVPRFPMKLLVGVAYCAPGYTCSGGVLNVENADQPILTSFRCTSIYSFTESIFTYQIVDADGVASPLYKQIQSCIP